MCCHHVLSLYPKETDKQIIFLRHYNRYKYNYCNLLQHRSSLQPKVFHYLNFLSAVHVKAMIETVIITFFKKSEYV